MTVSIGSEALSTSTIEDLFAYIGHQEREFSWASNFLKWDPGLTPGNGAVLAHKLPSDFTASLFLELQERGKLTYRPSEATALFYVWTAGSSIAWHRDYTQKSSMTIYLSKEWKPDYGGYFCWKDWEPGEPEKRSGHPPVEARMYFPLYNSYVHMTAAEWHSTTMTTPFAPRRFTLQLFFSHPKGAEESPRSGP